jgi:hypothetical protein
MSKNVNFRHVVCFNFFLIKNYKLFHLCCEKKIHLLRFC